MINDFFNLIFPKVCNACNQPLLKFEEVLCTACIYHLPKTNFHNERNNLIEQLFWGRVQLEKASAYYYFEKESKVQTLIHNLKYKGKTEIGVEIGKLYGSELKAIPSFQHLDYIIPVPLNKKRQSQRGYNQSDYFAQGLSTALNVVIENEAIKRTDSNTSQTSKSRFARWENVSDNFELSNKNQFQGKNILLVDDVITTGATIEACASPLVFNKCKVSVAAIAFSKG